MKLEAIFTEQELALIDGGNYKPGRVVLDAKLDLVAAMEREALCIAMEDQNTWDLYDPAATAIQIIKARSQTPCVHEWVDDTKLKPQWLCIKCGAEYTKENT
jgi:hypothetical protein